MSSPKQRLFAAIGDLEEEAKKNRLASSRIKTVQYENLC